MKILGISAVSPINFVKAKRSQKQLSFGNSTSPVMCQPLRKDTVSFKGIEEDDSVFDAYGLISKNNTDVEENDSVKSGFVINKTKNKDGKNVLKDFVWNNPDLARDDVKSKLSKVKFIGNERQLADDLADKKIPSENFNIAADGKYHQVSFDSEGLKYKLKYNRKTHELVSASAETIKENDSDVYERVSLRPSQYADGDYVVRYQFMHENKGELAIEDSFLLYKGDKQYPEVSKTVKKFQYSDGALESQEFTKVYTEDGEAKTVKGNVQPHKW